jgi:hypothetical protein
MFYNGLQLYLVADFETQNFKFIKMKIEEQNLNELQKPQLNIADVISRFSGENLIKLQKHFVSLYGSDEMAQEKANSFAVGFGKACEMMCKDLQNGL